MPASTALAALLSTTSDAEIAERLAAMRAAEEKRRASTESARRHC